MLTEQQRETLAGRARTARLNYLIEQKTAEYVRMHKSGELKAHLNLIGSQAADHYGTLLTQMEARAKERGETPNGAQIAFAAWELTLADIVHI